MALLVALLGAAPVAAKEPDFPYATGLEPSPEGNYPQVPPVLNAEPLPQSIDLSAGMPPVGNQAQQNSCVGWAIAYYYRSYQEGIESSDRPDTSDEIFSPSYIYNQRSTTCTPDRGMSLATGLGYSRESGHRYAGYHAV